MKRRVVFSSMSKKLLSKKYGTPLLLDQTDKNFLERNIAATKNELKSSKLPGLPRNPMLPIPEDQPLANLPVFDSSHLACYILQNLQL